MIDHYPVRNRIEQLVSQVGEIIVGKEHSVRLAVACLLARGHLLIEDIPGVGKTTLSHAIAGSLGLAYRRIQFTSDLLPADILGNSIFERDSQLFVFHPGPLFSQVVLIDEINRATPKTQSALLEAMEEGQVSADGVTHTLPSPFFVIATQNPRHQIGTFPLPESQLDRFTMCINLGFPGRESEREMLLGGDRRQLLREMQPVLTAQELAELQATVPTVHASNALMDYLQDLLEASRKQHGCGLSPRAGLALLRASQAWAMMARREMVLPEDVQAVGVYVMGHRLGTEGDAVRGGGRSFAETLLRTVPVKL